MAVTIPQVDQLLSDTCTNIFHCNIRSISKNVNLLLAFLSKHVHTFDVLAITETWLKKGETVHVPGYVTLSHQRDSCSRGVVVTFLMKSGYAFTELSSLNCSSADIEALFVRLHSFGIIGVVY